MPDVLTVEEAAEYLQISPGMLLRKVREGVVPGAKVGRHWRFSRRQLLAWVERKPLTNLGEKGQWQEEGRADDGEEGE